jgi:hypothetical protein
MENLGYPPDYPLLKKPLAESFKVFNNPLKIPKWNLPSNSRTRQSSLLLCPNLHTVSMPPGNMSYHRTSNSFVLFCTPIHLLNAHLAELSESSVILVLLELTTEFFYLHPYAYSQCPLDRALQNSSEILSATVLPYTALPPRYSKTLRSSSELMILVPMPTLHAFI